MSSAKQYNLQPVAVVAQLAVVANVTSIPTEIFNKDNIEYQYLWTGTLNGGFSVQTSLDYNPHTLTGTWDTVPIDAGAAAAGAPDHGTIELNQLTAKYVRTVFAYVSGTGNLTITICGKAV